jgi:hypothetical protein
LLFKAKAEGSGNQFLRNEERKKFLDNRDEVRLFEEYVEGLRRRKVISGEW